MELNGVNVRQVQSRCLGVSYVLYRLIPPGVLRRRWCFPHFAAEETET